MSQRFGASCTVLGGANGSGKSTIFGQLEAEGEFVNADLVARQIAPSDPASASFRAGKRVLDRLNRLIEARLDFVYETTLASHQALRLMETARAADYNVGLVFVVLRHSDLNLWRVDERVRQGGHSIPKGIIRRRYEGGFANLPRAITLAHHTTVFDNSEPGGIQKLIQIAETGITLNALDEARLVHCRIAEAVSNALNISVDTVFRAAKPG